MSWTSSSVPLRNDRKPNRIQDFNLINLDDSKNHGKQNTKAHRCQKGDWQIANARNSLKNGP